MDSIDALFVAFGGPAAVGRIIGKSTEHAATLKRRRSIPVRYWPALIAAASAAGKPLDAERLTRLHADQTGVAA